MPYNIFILSRCLRQLVCNNTAASNLIIIHNDKPAGSCIVFYHIIGNRTVCFQHTLGHFIFAYIIFCLLRVQIGRINDTENGFYLHPHLFTANLQNIGFACHQTCQRRCKQHQNQERNGSRNIYDKIQDLIQHSLRLQAARCAYNQ